MRRSIWIVVWAAPSLWVAWMIRQYGVDVPHLDQWNGMAPLFAKGETGTLRLGDFFALHNEHRAFFPRLLMYGLARLTQWSVPAELFVIWLLAWLCAFNYMRIAQVTGFPLFRRPVLVLLTATLVFTPLAAENWLWGFQIGFLLPVACMTATMWAAPSLSFPWNYLAAMALCIVSTLSIASGMVAWLLAFPLLLFVQGEPRWRDRKRWWLFYIACFAVFAAAYLHGYRKPENHPSIVLALEQPVEALRCLLAFLGGPFAHGLKADTIAVATSAGAFLLMALAGVLAYLWRHRADKDLVMRALPWLALTGVAFANGALVTMGRLGLGIADAALPSRYMPFSTTLPIGLLFLIPMVFDHWRSGAAPNATLRAGIGLGAVAGSLALLHLAGSAATMDLAKHTKRLRLSEKATVLCSTVVDDPGALATYVHPNFPRLRDVIRAVDRLGYLRPRALQSPLIREIAASTAPANSNTFGEVEEAATLGGGSARMAGWAVLRAKRRPADLVLLTYDDANGEPTIFALAPVGAERPDIAAELQSPDYRFSGWNHTFRIHPSMSGEFNIRAWAFDAELRAAYPLAESIAP